MELTLGGTLPSLPSLDPGSLQASGSMFKVRGEVGDGRKRGSLPALR